MSRQNPVDVSIIVPFFDTPETFLREAVDSALAQTGVGHELLLVDDGSSAGTRLVAQELSRLASGRIRYLAHADGAHKGTSATRNLGVASALGRYLAFLDSDDVWRQGKLVEQVEILESLPDVAMVFGLSEYWYGHSPKSPEAPRSFIPDAGAKRRRVLRPPEFVTAFIRGRMVVPNPSNFMVRRDSYVACGGFEESFPGMYDDQVFLAKIGLDNDVCVVPRCWDRYRQHPDSLSAQADRNAEEEQARRRFLLWLRGYCRERRLDWAQVIEVVEKELWLLGEAHVAGTGSGSRMTRWGKKWLLRLEEALVPSGVRRRWWCRRHER